MLRKPVRSLALAAAAWLGLGAAGRDADAAPPIDLGGGTIQLEVQLPDGDGGYVVPSEEDQIEHFNRANCLCSGEPEAQFGLEFTLEGTSGSLDSEPVDVWFGTQCDSPEAQIRDQNCQRVHTFSDVESLRNPQVVGFSIEDLLGGCGPQDRSPSAFALIDEDDDGIGDGDYATPAFDVPVDTEPPPPPREVTVSGGEGAIQVSWELPEERPDDLEFFQFLCIRADGSSAARDDFPRDVTREYLTADDVCGVRDPSICPIGAVERAPAAGGDGDAGADDADAGAGDQDAGAPVECADLPGGLEDLDPGALCGSVEGTATGHRIEGLENGVAYRVVMIVVDPSRNPLALDLGEHTPRPARDFWEEYHDAGGRAQGGCSAGGAGGGVMLLLLAAAIAILLRRRGRGLAAGALVLLLAGPRGAAAQPWWEDADAEVQEAVGSTPVHWNFEIKAAPYVPAVDGEFDLDDGEAGPFERMFGDGPFLMTTMTLDRFFLYPGGQLGLSASVGFLSKTVRAFELDADGNTIPNSHGNPRRSPGDETAFRLVPMSLGVVYRYTQLDDLVRIPVVPYGRIGLSYYGWWVNGPGGDLAEVPTAGCPDVDSGDCEGDRARGGSWGWQGTVGLGVRLERLDPDAEISLRTELGIEHAGLVGELTYAEVDGFGSDRKLAVGDVTWFGGINFEF